MIPKRIIVIGGTAAGPRAATTKPSAFLKTPDTPACGSWKADSWLGHTGEQ